MTDQSPYAPQQPYQPYPQPSAPSAGQPGYAQAGMPQSPYEAAPYAQQPMGAYPSMAYPQAMGPTRPGTATAASVLGIISGGLGLIVSILVIIGTSAIDTATSRTALEDALGTLMTINYLIGFGVLITAVALLTTGITFLKGKGYGILLGAAIAA